MVACLFYTYVLLLRTQRTQRQRAEKSTHGIGVYDGLVSFARIQLATIF